MKKSYLKYFILSLLLGGFLLQSPAQAKEVSESTSIGGAFSSPFSDVRSNQSKKANTSKQSTNKSSNKQSNKSASSEKKTTQVPGVSDALIESNGGEKVVSLDAGGETKDITEEVKEEEEENPYTNLPITYDNYKDHLDRFTSKVWFGDDWFGMGSETLYFINSVVQAVFWVNKFIFMVCSKIYEFLTTDVISQQINTVLSVSSGIFNRFKEMLLPIVGSSIGFYLTYLYFIKNQNFFKQFLRIVVIFLMITSYFMRWDGDYTIKKVYDTFATTTTELSQAAMESTQSIKDSGQAKLLGESKSGVLDKYFDTAIWKPYQYMNSERVTDENGNTSFKLTDEELRTLLAYDSGDSKFQIGEETIEEFAGKEKKPNVKMLKSAWGDKFLYAFVSILDTFLLGLVLDMIALVSLILQMMVLLLLLLAPFALTIAMFPTMENILFNLTKSLFGNIAVSSFMSVIAIFILYFYDILTEVLLTIFNEDLILAVIVKYLVLYIMWKRRDYILGILTGNRIRSLNVPFERQLSRVGHRVKQKTLRRAQDGALDKLALGSAVIGGAYKMGRRRMSRARSKVAEDAKDFARDTFYGDEQQYSPHLRRQTKQTGSRTERAKERAKNKSLNNRRVAGLKVQSLGQKIGMAGSLVSHGLTTLQNEYYQGTSDQSGLKTSSRASKVSEKLQNSQEFLVMKKERLAKNKLRQDVLTGKMDLSVPAPPKMGQANPTKTWHHPNAVIREKLKQENRVLKAPVSKTKFSQESQQFVSSPKTKVNSRKVQEMSVDRADSPIIRKEKVVVAKTKTADRVKEKVSSDATKLNLKRPSVSSKALEEKKERQTVQIKTGHKESVQRTDSTVTSQQPDIKGRKR